MATWRRSGTGAERPGIGCSTAGASQIPIETSPSARPVRSSLKNFSSTTTHHYLSVNCRDGSHDPDSSGRCHIGTWPKCMHRFVIPGVGAASAAGVSSATEQP